MSQNANTVAEKIYAIIVDSLACDPDKIKSEAVLIDDLGADSLDIIEITMNVEEAFNIEITDDEMLAINTVGESVNLVDSKLAAKAAG